MLGLAGVKTGRADGDDSEVRSAIDKLHDCQRRSRH